MRLTRHLYQALSLPFVYRAVQLLAAPGAQHALQSIVRESMQGVASGAAVLDVGCGPQSWLESMFGDITGIDIETRYLESARSRGNVNVAAASATSLPFAEDAFDVSFSFGVFHHLSDSEVRSAFEEMIRVTSPEGRIVIVDAVTPAHKWQVLAYLIRRADRGDFVRSQSGHVALLGPPANTVTKRYRYSVTGLEALATVIPKSELLALHAKPAANE
jgi:ubiquinone/menaquinone biosynthesis C-methylase UbiE